jgi:hypothetical protein
MMAAKVKDNRSIGDQIKAHFQKNQTWLAIQTGISEAQLSRKIKGTKEWTQEELDKVNKILGTHFKL